MVHLIDDHPFLTAFVVYMVCKTIYNTVVAIMNGINGEITVEDDE